MLVVGPQGRITLTAYIWSNAKR